jgi:hypothetical protein
VFYRVDEMYCCRWLIMQRILGQICIKLDLYEGDQSSLQEDVTDTGVNK